MPKRSQSLSQRIYERGGRLVEETIADFQSKEEAIALVRKAKLPVPKRPINADGEEIHPRLPFDLPHTTTDKLGRLLGQFTSLADYASVAAAEADIELSVAEHVYEYVKSTVRLSKTGTVQDKSDKTTIDPQVKAAAQNYYRALALSKLTTQILRACERDLATISREISRRGQDMDRHRA